MAYFPRPLTCRSRRFRGLQGCVLAYFPKPLKIEIDDFGVSRDAFRCTFRSPSRLEIDAFGDEESTPHGAARFVLLFCFGSDQSSFTTGSPKGGLAAGFDKLCIRGSGTRRMYT